MTRPIPLDAQLKTFLDEVREWQVAALADGRLDRAEAHAGAVKLLRAVPLLTCVQRTMAMQKKLASTAQGVYSDTTRDYFLEVQAVNMIPFRPRQAPDELSGQGERSPEGIQRARTRANATGV